MSPSWEPTVCDRARDVVAILRGRGARAVFSGDNTDIFIDKRLVFMGEDVLDVADCAVGSLGTSKMLPGGCREMLDWWDSVEEVLDVFLLSWF